jgi:ParB family transcriptional regulator, chromosome partitioning protein
MAQNRGLGRGLSALIPGVTTKPAEEKFENTILEIPLTKIVPNKNQPRKTFKDESIDDLADSIRTFGLIQPIIVRNLDRGGMYEIISGERRFRASKLLGLPTIPCIINHDIDDLASLEMALIENVQRDDLTPIEISHSYKQLIDEFKLTHEELSKRIGKSRASITNSIRLLLLPLEIQKMINEGALSAGHARALVSIENREAQISLAENIVKNDLSVRETEKLAGKVIKQLSGETGVVGQTPKNDKILQFNKLPVIEKAVSDYLETPVNIKVSKNKGRIEIIFGSVKDFERIVYKIIDKRTETQ